MNLNEALRILIDEGMLVEKKYRTTPEERQRSKNSWYDTYGGGTIEEKTQKIIEEFELGEYLTKVSYGERSVDIYYTENKTLNYLIDKLEERFSFETRTYNSSKYMKFVFDVDSKLVRDNQYITNQYGFEKQIKEYYAKFRQICKILSKELNRKRGKL